MKVGIVTLYGENFGNKLQNLAVQKLLEAQGCEAETVRIKNSRKIPCPQSVSDTLKKFAPSYLSRAFQSRFKNKYHYKNSRDGVIGSICWAKTGAFPRLEQERVSSYKRFSDQHIRLSDITVAGGTSYLDAGDFDAFVCGSDQVWNPTYPSTCDAFFLAFAESYQRIAVSPSFGLSELPEYVKPAYKKWLSEIPHLSVREEKGAKIIAELTGREVPVLSDPTMCVSRATWESVEKMPDYPVADKFVLTYFLGNETNKYRAFIERYARDNGAEIINLLDLREPEHYATAPDEFIWLIHHADAVMTDSFHGMVFSLIFHTPFVAFDRIEDGGMSMSSRMETLLKRFSMENRRFRGMTSENIKKVDFSSVDEIIAEQTQRVTDYLSNALSAVATAEHPSDSPVSYLVHKSDCTGCGACANACPKHCISMQADEEGFLYPHIDADACVHCKLCEKTCPVVQNKSANAQPTAYAGYAKDEKLRSSSSSGGIFSVLAEAVLADGGVVYGAGFDESFRVKHMCVTSADKLSTLRGSKYVQSEIGDTYSQVKESLEQGVPVYFSGTPCQVEALLSYLGKDYDNLITQDIICHGVPSPAVWNAYTHLLSNGESIQEISFRSKKYGWAYFSLKARTSEKTHEKRLDEDDYLRLFLDNVILRPSCYECSFKKLHRLSDFMLADCWKPQKTGCTIPNDDKGISLLFANTDKARKLLESVTTRCTLQPLDFEKASSSQSSMTTSVPHNSARSVFFARVREEGMPETVRTWYGHDLIRDSKTRINYYKSKIKSMIS